VLGFVEIQCDMGLALMVGFVPADDMNGAQDGELTGGERGGDFLQPVVAVVTEGDAQGKSRRTIQGG